MTDWRGEVGIQPWLEALAGRDPWIHDIAVEVAQKHGISLCELKGPRRDRTYSIPRQEFFYRALAETKLASTVIGRWCGKRDHATCFAGGVAHARRHDLPKARTGNFNKG